MSKVRPLARRSEIVVQEMNGEILIYDLRTDRALSLNETSSLVWQHCDGSNSIVEIAEKMSGLLNKSVSEDLVWLALDSLKKEKLIENQIETPFAGISRREIIRQIGTSSLIALPVIGTLVAPIALHAQSGCTTGSSGRALGCPCTAIPQCAPPSGRCCLSSTGAPGNQTCVPAASQISNGGPCGNSCSCTSNCCSGGLCTAAASVPPGGSCTINCACTSGTCSAGNCV